MKISIAICLALLVFTSNINTVSAASPSVSDWVETPYSGIRLIAGAQHGDTREVGIQIRMQPGWKTYWKIPGDSGIPPLFDWSGSSNVSGATVMYPAPKRYVDEYATSIGYKDEVVFPVRLTPTSKVMPTVARVTVSYAVCSDICLPASAELTLDLAAAPRASTIQSALIERFKKKVPTKVSDNQPRIASVQLTGSGEKASLVVDVDQKPGSPDVDIFIEGPRELYFAGPKRQTAPGPDDTARYSIAIDGVTPSLPLKGEHLVFTVVGEHGAYEQHLSVN